MSNPLPTAALLLVRRFGDPLVQRGDDLVGYRLWTRPPPTAQRVPAVILVMVTPTTPPREFPVGQRIATFQRPDERLPGPEIQSLGRSLRCESAVAVAIADSRCSDEGDETSRQRYRDRQGPVRQHEQQNWDCSGR